MTPKALQQITRNALSIISRWIGLGTKQSHDSKHSKNSVEQSSVATFDIQKEQHGRNSYSGALRTKTAAYTQPRTKSAENLLRCVICELLLPSAKALGRHYSSGQHQPNQSKESPSRVGGVGGVKCPDCNLEFESVSDQRWHEMGRHRN